MSTTTKLGNLAVAVGSYTAGSDTKKRFRTIGELMKATDSEGERLWIKLNGEALSPSLLDLIRATDMKPGDDQVTVRVFEPRDPS